MEHAYNVLFAHKKHECNLGGGFWQGFYSQEWELK